jgi:hypothetical protein
MARLAAASSIGTTLRWYDLTVYTLNVTVVLVPVLIALAQATVS